MALVTTFMTTPLLELVFPARELAKELYEPDAGARGSLEALPAGAGFTVLMCVAYDRSGPGMVTLARAVAGGDEDARLYALRLVPPADRASQYVDAPPERQIAEALEPLIQRAESLNVTVRPISFVSLRPAQDICNVAEVKRADLVLMGWHKPVLGRTVLGGTVQEVMKSARANVGVFIDRGLRAVERVLVPYQGTSDDRAALRIARRLTQRAGVDVTILHVVTPDRAGMGAKEKLEETFEEQGGGNRSSVRMKLVSHATPSEAAIEESRKGYDLVIVGAGEEWGLEPKLFGLVPEDIVRECPASLLILRSFEGQKTAAVAKSRDPYPTSPAALETSHD
jgi:nucleotide-binding universal stress UspA family protein